jgi:non-specific serine/threonine protein kinase
VAEALAVQQRLGDRWGVSSALRETAALTLDDGHGDDGATSALLAESLSLALSVHDRPSVAAGLELLARLHARTDPTRAAQLLGCASGLEHALNDPLAGPGRSEDWVTALRATLGDPAFADAWARGRAMSLHEAVAFALGQDDASSLSV